MKAQKPARRKRRMLAQQLARLKAANDRAEARLKAMPTKEKWAAAAWAAAFKPYLRRKGRQK